MSLDNIVPYHWDIFGNGKIDNSTMSQDIQVYKPANMNFPAYWGQGNGAVATPVFNISMAGQYACYYKAYIQMTLKILNQYTGGGGGTSPYAPGTPVALVPDLAATFCDRYYFKYGGAQIEAPNSNVMQSTMVNNLLDYTYDRAQGQRGESDAFILDYPGQTQFITSLIITGSTSGTLYQFVVLGTSPYYLGLKVINNGTPSAGEILSVSYPTVTGSVPVYASSSTNVTLVMELGTATGSYYNFLIYAPSGGTTTTNNPIYLTTNTSNLTLYDTSIEPNGSLSMVVTAGATGGATSQVTITLSPTNASTLTAGDNIGVNNLDNNFWKRQQLTDAGTVFTARIMLADFINFCRDYKHPIIGQTAELQLYTSGTTLQQMLQCGPGVYNTGSSLPGIYVYDMYLVVPFEVPSMRVDRYLRDAIESGASSKFVWRNTVAFNAPSFTAGTTNYSAQVSLPAEVGDPEWIFVMFMVTSYINNYNYNTFASFVPTIPAGSTTGNPISTAYIRFGGYKYPQKQYGDQPSDFQRIYNTVLEASNKFEKDGFSPAWNKQQYLQNYFILPFDLRKRAGTGSAIDDANCFLAVTFANALGFTSLGIPSTATITPYVVARGRRISSFTAINGQMIYSSDDSVKQIDTQGASMGLTQGNPNEIRATVGDLAGMGLGAGMKKKSSKKH